MPSYLVVARTIQARIESGHYAPGAALPTTERIAAEFDVSKDTVYAAMRHLRDNGIIRTVQGGGRYVPKDEETDGDDADASADDQ